MKKETTKQALEFLPNDKEFREQTLTAVKVLEDGIQLSMGGCEFISPTHPTFTPKEGMNVKLYGKGFGYPVRGVVIEDVVFFYRTPEEAEQDHKEYCEEMDRKRKQEFEDNKVKMDADYNSLPEVFQRRIDRFRKHNPNFRWEYEPYELFCCKEAVKIANTLKTAEKIKKWHKMDYEKQLELVKLDHGHSGNSIGCSTLLASLFITKPELIVEMHGALTPLVGCKAYGCYHEET